MNINNIFNEIIEKSKSWSDFKNSLPSDASLSGKIFEIFTKYYFLIDPKVRDDYKNVWLYNEIPSSVKEKLNIGNVEHGVDLILEEFSGEIIAVQCKYRTDESTNLSWTKDKIANLFGFIPTADNYTVFTNASEIDEVSKTRYDNFRFYNIHDLLEIKEFTFQSISNLIKYNQLPAVDKYTPKPHQVEAIKKSLDYFKDNSRGQLILPCGAGKTLTSLWIKEAINPCNTLVLVPSLALLRQIKNDWAEQRSDKYNYICVCSDKDIDSPEKDSIVMHTYEIDSKVISEPKRIKEFLSGNSDKVIFSTYQSLEKIINATEGTNIEFDLIICDEAHRTAGAKTGLFSLVHDNEKVSAKKRLYMTATPRVTSTQLKNKIGDDTDLLYDMSNPIVYGNEIYRMSFKEAIEKGILVDYKIIAIGVTDDEIKKYIEERRYISENESIDEIANNFALEIVMKKYNANHAISFHSRVKYAEQFSQRHSKLFDYFSSHVNGSQKTSLRSQILTNFKNSEKSVVSNARCLTEGVDIPAIDLVYFCDPKNSKVDIVQAAGRALRTDHSSNKTIGYIVVPIFHDNNDNIESTINTGSFRNVIQVIRSLSDHDERLQDEINQIAYNKGKKNSKKIEITINNENSEVISLINFHEKLRKSLFDQIIEKSSNNWDLMYSELKKWLTEKKQYPSKVENYQLYSWVGSQRNRKKNNQLSNNQIKKLEAIDFIWDSHKTVWDQKYNELKKYRLTNDYEPSEQENKDLYRWVQSQKAAQKKALLSNVRIQLLKDLNFKGTFVDTQWDDKYELLLKFRNDNPEKWPSQRSKEPTEHKLAVWFLQIRREYKTNILGEYRTNKLNSIQFPWEPYDYKWLNFYNKLISWIKEYQDFPKSNLNNKIESSLYLWCCRQEELYITNNLESTYKENLDAIDFIKFIEYQSESLTWDDKYELLLKFRNDNPEKWPSQRSKEPTEQKLAVWSYNQRKKYKENILSKTDFENLSSIGFIFDTEKKREDLWDKKFLDLQIFRKNNPNRWPNFNSENNEEKNLAIWMNYNRQWQKGNRQINNTYPSDRKNKLDSINFEWESEKGAFGHVDNWDDRFFELKQQIEDDDFKYQDSEGKINPIYSWLVYQKNKYKENKLDKEQIEKLESLGIDLSINTIAERSNISWDDYYNELKNQIENNEFKSYDKQGKVTPCYGWLTRQKNQFRENKLDKEKLEKLESLGIDLSINTIAERSNISWDDYYNELKNQIENNEFKSIDVDGKTSKLYRWLTRQKDLFKENKLSFEKIEKFLTIGINLESNSLTPSNNDSWDNFYNQLKNHITTNKTTVIQSQINGKANPLYNWLQRQKSNYENNKLNSDMIDKLKSIGILD